MIVWLSDTAILEHKSFTKTYNIGGKNITFESWKLALLVDGSVVIKDDIGNYFLTTAWISDNVREGIDFFPMTVEFQEKYYATGKIGGNRFMKREWRNSDGSILNARMVDRPIRPMFPKWIINEVQIITTVYSSSGSDFGHYGITGASLALMLSGTTEFEWPVAGLRIALVENTETWEQTYIVNPEKQDLKWVKIDLTVAGTLDAITMIESQAYEVEDALMVKTLEYAHKIVKEICNAQLDFLAWYSAIHPLPKSKVVVKHLSKELFEKIESFVTEDKMTPLYHVGKLEFHEEMHKLSELAKEWLGYTEDTEEMRISEIEECVYKAIKKHMRKKVLNEKIRLDWRKVDQVRPVFWEFGILPRTHGSALFQRWVTQALTITTLGWLSDIQLIDDMFEEETKRYIHHYNFPPFSVGEIKPVRWPGRREIGHGRLAEKALEPVIPTIEEFPYFIRVVSEIPTCNGSSSMASVCGSSMSLMDAWVPIKSIVSGVAMWMIYDEESGKLEILSDIQAQEDFLWDMDFKVAGTPKWITALQMDCKVKGLSMEVISKVLSQSKNAMDFIRTEMTKELQIPRSELSSFAPCIISMKVAPEKVREVIGKWWETIQRITKEYGVKMDINDAWIINIVAKTQEQGKIVADYVTKMVKWVEAWDVGIGKVAKIIEWVGAIIEIWQNKTGLIHISKISKERVNVISDYLKIGDMVNYRVLTVDMANNKIGLERILETEKSEIINNS